jgi:hypothetical protein
MGYRSICAYGYWVYDPVYDYYYWFTADVVIVDASWVSYP